MIVHSLIFVTVPPRECSGDVRRTAGRYEQATPTTAAG